MQNTLIAILSCLTLLLAHACGIDRGRADKQSEIERLKREVMLYQIRDEIIYRESRWKYDAVGDAGKAKNLSQAHFPTFRELAIQCGMPKARYDYPADHIKILDCALRMNKGHLWTTYKASVKKVTGGT